MNDDEHESGKAVLGVILLLGIGLYFLATVIFT